MSKNVSRCKKCKGQKTIMGMGGMSKKCSTCKGIGYVDNIEERDIDSFLDPPEKKKRKYEKRKKDFSEEL